MTENPYQTPRSTVERDALAERQFYVVAATKFSILFFSTLSLYSIYWFYKNWQCYRLQTQVKLWPVPRAIYSVFFAYSLFAKIHQRLKENGKAFGWEPGLLALSYILISLAAMF